MTNSLLTPRETAVEQHAVFATTHSLRRVRVEAPASWGTAQDQWLKLDDARREGYFPHVKFFEVRSMDDPGYKDAPVSFAHGRRAVSGRGFTNAQSAAKRAWKLFAPEFTDKGRVAKRYDRFLGNTASDRTKSTDQGRGGWFYYPNGETAAQGGADLFKLAHRKGLVAKGVEGKYSKWFVLDMVEKA